MSQKAIFSTTLDTSYTSTSTYQPAPLAGDQQKYNYIKIPRKSSRRASSNASPRSSKPNPYLQPQQSTYTSSSISSAPSLPSDTELNFGVLNNSGPAPPATFTRRNSSLNSLINASNPFSTFYAHPKQKHSLKQARLGRSVPDSIPEDGDDELLDTVSSLNEEENEVTRVESVSSIYEYEEDFEEGNTDKASKSFDMMPEHTENAKDITVTKKPVLSVIEIPTTETSRLSQHYEQRYPRNHRHSSHISPRTHTQIRSYANSPISTISNGIAAPLNSHPTTEQSAVTTTPFGKPSIIEPYPYPNPYPSISAVTPKQPFTSASSPKYLRQSLQLRIMDSATSPTNIEKQQQQQDNQQDQYVSEKISMWQHEENARRRSLFGRVRMMFTRMTPRQRVAFGIVLAAVVISVAVVLGVVLARDVVWKNERWHSLKQS